MWRRYQAFLGTSLYPHGDSWKIETDGDTCDKCEEDHVQSSICRSPNAGSEHGCKARCGQQDERKGKTLCTILGKN